MNTSDRWHTICQNVCYLTRSENDPVVVLLSMVFVFLQLLPSQTHRHRAQILIYPQVIPVL